MLHAADQNVARNAAGRSAVTRGAATPGAVTRNAITRSVGSPLPDPERRRLILHLAQSVALARHRAGWTQSQLARAADLSRATVHLIEAGACDPRLSTITSLAKALGLPPISLFDEPPRDA